MNQQNDWGLHGMPTMLLWVANITRMKMVCKPVYLCTTTTKDVFWAVGVDAKGATDAMVKYGAGNSEQSGYFGEMLRF